MTAKHLLLVFDEKLVKQSQVLIKGIRECLAGDIFFYCVVPESLSADICNSLINFGKEIGINVEIRHAFSPWKNFDSRARAPIAYQKFLWDHLFSIKSDYLLYLDIDVVPIRSFNELFEIKFNNAFAAVALDDFISKRFVRWNLTANGGVNLFNVEAWKKNNLSQRAIDLITNFKPINELSADLVLNKIYYNQWYKLESKYNSPYLKTFYPAYVFHRSPISLVHFIGPKKPWLTKVSTPFNAHIIRTYKRRQSDVFKIINSLG